jgi:hypothetical protein
VSSREFFLPQIDFLPREQTLGFFVFIIKYKKKRTLGIFNNSLEFIVKVQNVFN